MKQLQKETIIHQTELETGKTLQWFYDYKGNYTEIVGFFKDYNERKVVLTKKEELPKYFLWSKHNEYYYEIK